MASPPSTVDDLRRALGLQLLTRPDRAVILTGRVDPALWDEASGAILAAVGGDANQVVIERIEGAEDRRNRLTELNRMRDQLLPAVSVIALLATTPEGIWSVRKYANDLTIAPSLVVDLRAPLPVLAWDAVADSLRSRAIALYGMLDLTGLIPGTAERSALPLAEIYMPLVRLPNLLGAESDIPRPRRLLVLGNPGAGKTTWLRYLACEMAEGRDPLGVGGAVPVLVPLADYGLAREREIRPLREFIVRWLVDAGVEGAGALAERWSETALLLDGLDEIRDEAGRREVIEQVVRWTGPDAPRVVVMSGRVIVVDDLRAGDATVLTVIQCRPPGRHDVRRFLTAFASLRARGNSGRITSTTDLAGRIFEDPDLNALARNPLLLVFLALLDELEGRLPDRRIEIYYRMGELLVERWTRARSASPTAAQRVRATRADALRVLGPLATWLVEESGGVAVSEDELLARLTSLEADRSGRDGAQQRARTLLDLLARDTAMLARDQWRRWSFAHSSIAEYFAAIEACRDPVRWAALLENPFLAERRELVTFAAGYLGIISGEDARLHALVSAVLGKARRAGRYDAKHPLLLMALVAEQPGLTPADERELLSRTGEFVFTTHFGREAAWVVQQEFIAFLDSGRGRAYEEATRETLRAWCIPPRLRMDRLLAASQVPGNWRWPVPAPRASIARRSWKLIEIGGPLLERLPDLLETYGLDATPLLDLLTASTDSRCRCLGQTFVQRRASFDASDPDEAEV